MNVASTIRRVCVAGLKAHVIKRGVSTDYYHPTPCYHPMAEAKHLSSIAALLKLGYMSETLGQQRVAASLKRLDRTGVLVPNGESAATYWGLGFPYKSAPSNEPYLITSSLIALSLLEVFEALEQPENILPTLEKRLADLQAWPWRMQMDNGLSLPAFSPSVQQPIHNAIAVWASVIAKAARLGLGTPNPEIEPAVHWLTQGFLPNFGWPYAPENGRIDLLHQCYTLSAMCRIDGHAAWEDRAAIAISAFFSGNRIVDHFSIFPIDQAYEKSLSSKRWSMRFHLDTAQYISPVPARPWSLGELLVIVSELAMHGQRPEYWRNLLRQICQVSLSSDNGDEFDAHHYIETMTEHFGLRHVMHICHGAAMAWGSLRSADTASITSPSEEGDDKH